MSYRRIFVTVGTTEFDELISVVSSPEFCSAALSKGCECLTLQVGRGSFDPQYLQRAVSATGLECNCFRFCDTLGEFINNATLIISHAGAGSIIESLHASSRPYIVVVVNESLMDNHQAELAGAMADRGHCSLKKPSELVSMVEQDQLLNLVLYPAPKYQVFPHYIDRIML